MPDARTLVLDLDGTLVDTARDLVAALNVVLASEGLPPVSYDQALPMVGHGARAMIEAALLAAGERTTPGRLDRLTVNFIDHYSSHIAEYSLPFPGAAEALDRFTAAGWRLAICTNKLERLAKQLLEELALADRFAAIIGQDTFGVRKPDPAALLGTIKRAGGNRDAAIMVGDSQVDVAVARAARVPVIAVSFGYSPIPVRELAADQVIDHFDWLFPAATHLTRQGAARSASEDVSALRWPPA